MKGLTGTRKVRVARASTLAGGFACVAVAASANTLDLFFEEPLGGVYAQYWSGRVIGPDTVGGVLVYVRGDGKSGDFHGVLNVNCETPARSEWVAVGGVIGPDAVPAPAVDVIRAEACGSP